jgi:hypothetical protein
MFAWAGVDIFERQRRRDLGGNLEVVEKRKSVRKREKLRGGCKYQNIY